MRLIEISQSPRHLWNGAVCAPNGRLFATMPGWQGPTPGVVEVAEDGSWTPFPGDQWNQWSEGGDPLTSFVDVNSAFADDRGSLWVLDAAAPYFNTAIEGAVKLVEIDLASNKVVRVIRFDSKHAHQGTRLAHIRIVGHFGILAESKEGSFYVVDLRDNSYRRILVGHPLTRCRPDDVPSIEGRRIHLEDGRPMYIHNDLLELSPDRTELYFMCLFGSKIYRVPVDVLTDSRNSDDEIAARVDVMLEVGPWIAGMCRDKLGNIYLSDAERNGIQVLRPDGTLQMLCQDERLVWPIAISVGPDGYVYIPASQLNRIPMFSGGKELVRPPWKIFKFKATEVQSKE